MFNWAATLLVLKHGMIRWGRNGIERGSVKNLSGLHFTEIPTMCRSRAALSIKGDCSRGTPPPRGRADGSRAGYVRVDCCASTAPMLAREGVVRQGISHRHIHQFGGLD